jgi:hypothetical protein
MLRLATITTFKKQLIDFVYLIVVVGKPKLKQNR